MADTQEAPKKVLKKTNKTPIKKKPSTPKADTSSVPSEKPSVPNTPTASVPKDTSDVTKSAKQGSTTKVSFLLWLIWLLSPTVILLFVSGQNSWPLPLVQPKGGLYQRDEKESKRKKERLKEYSIQVRRLTLKQRRPRNSHLNYQQHHQLTKIYHTLK